MIRLIDLLQTCNDSMILKIYNTDYDIIAKYDGKDAIDNNWNDKQIVWIYPTTNNELNVGLA